MVYNGKICESTKVYILCPPVIKSKVKALVSPVIKFYHFNECQDFKIISK